MLLNSSLLRHLSPTQSSETASESAKPPETVNKFIHCNSLTASETVKVETPQELPNISPPESAKPPEIQTKGNYKRTFSGGLQSPRADVPKAKLLERINSKKAAKSYQLGNQLSLKWSTGAGPRIGCVADYPVEVRVQALEFVNLSPRTPPTPSAFGRAAGLVSPTSFSPMGIPCSTLRE